MEYRTNEAKNLQWLDTFYASCGYGGRVDPDDVVVYAADNEKPIGVGRLSVDNGVVVLRGMQVIEKYRGRGIGTSLLNGLVEELHGRECFCLSYTHLLGFYHKAGFMLCSITEAPVFLNERLLSYRARDLDVQIIVRRGIMVRENWTGD